MNRILTMALALVASSSLMTMAQTPTPRFAAADGENQETYALDYGYCWNPNRYLNLGEGKNYGAILLTVDNLKQYAGCQVSEIGVVTGYNSFDDTNHIKEVTVFVAPTLDADPVIETTGELTSAVGEWNFIQLDEPFDITGEESFYIGYYFDAPSTEDLGIVGDGMYPWPGTGDLVAYGTDFTSLEWGSVENSGALCIKARIEGEAVPHDQININSTDFPYHILPGESFDCTIGLYNTGVNDIYSIDIRLTAGSDEPIVQTVELSSPIPYNGMASLPFSLSIDDVKGNVPVRIEIPTVNGGKPNLSKNMISYESWLLCLGEGLKRNVLCEEGTGTWCGYCPQGIVGMSWMKENYQDGSFIPVAVHLSNGLPEPMDVVGNPYKPEATIEEYCYRPMTEHFFMVPSSYFNRVYNGNTSISVLPDKLEEAFIKWGDIPAIASLEGKAAWTDETKSCISLSVNTSFIINEEEAEYRVGYIVTEDNVGPYMQTNYYSGGNYGEMYGWEDMPEQVEWTYDDVARNCSKPYGFEASLPSSITNGSQYEYNAMVSLDDVQNPDNCHLIAVIINNKTGVVENASYVPIDDYTAMKTVLSEGDDNVEWFTLQGIRLNAPVKNVPLIRKCGTTTQKVILN